MSKYSIDSTTLTSIGDAIRAKEGNNNSIMVSDIATRISNLTTAPSTVNAGTFFSNGNTGATKLSELNIDWTAAMENPQTDLLSLFIEGIYGDFIVWNTGSNWTEDNGDYTLSLVTGNNWQTGGKDDPKMLGRYSGALTNCKLVFYSDGSMELLNNDDTVKDNPLSYGSRFYYTEEYGNPYIFTVSL